MKQKIYTVYDVKSETYTAPSLNPARGQAIRSFQDAVNDPKGGVLASHPEDFTLFELGDFDIKTGLIELYETKQAVANGLDVKTSV